MTWFSTLAGIIFVVAAIIAVVMLIAGWIIKQIYITKDLRACTKVNAERMAQGLPPFELQPVVKRLKRSTAPEQKDKEA